MLFQERRIDKRFMREALALARKGTHRVFPNPRVGCVVVKNGKIVGKGFHEYFGGPHAEVNALAKAGKNAIGSTLYVTLEPCNHFGKTPPCTMAIINAGVSRVVAATRDLNTHMRGKGLKKLQANGLKVSVGVMRSEAEKLNSRFLRIRRSPSAAVIVKAAMSADGKIATRTGDSKWISSATSRAFVHRLRSSVDAIVVGRNTVLRDNPLLTSHGKGPNPVRVVLDTELTVPAGSKVFNVEAPTILFYKNGRQKKKLKALRRKRVIAVRLTGRDRNAVFKEVIARLNKFSLHRILVEGGGETIASAIESGLATDLILFIAPKIIGGATAITPVEGNGIARINNAVPLLNSAVKRIGSDFVLTAKLRQKKT